MKSPDPFALVTLAQTRALESPRQPHPYPTPPILQLLAPPSSRTAAAFLCRGLLTKRLTPHYFQNRLGTSNEYRN